MNKLEQLIVAVDTKRLTYTRLEEEGIKLSPSYVAKEMEAILEGLVKLRGILE